MSTHIPRKRFGQHFLHDRGVIMRIVQAIDPRPYAESGQRIVEIGPGLGALTVPVLERCGRMDAVELDRDVIPRLVSACAGKGELIVHQVDALQFNFADLAEPGKRLRVIGNLPYNISTPLMFHLFEQKADGRPAIADMTFMLQLEVCQRLAAAPNTEHYGRLSVMAQYHARVDYLFHVGRGAFNPPPKVESGIVRLTPHVEPPVDVGDKAVFSAMVAQAFNMRRKTLRNGLKGYVDEAGFASVGIDPVRRPETLSLDEFAALSRAASNRPRPGLPAPDGEGHVAVHPDADALAEAVAARWAELAEQAIRRHGRFTVALSGGRTPRILYELLASPRWRERLPWDKTELYLGDERCVAAEHADSNARMVRESLLERLPSPPLFFPLVTAPECPEQDAARYAALLRERIDGVEPAGRQEAPIPCIDLVLLGMGADGHFASLFPGSLALEDRESLVLPVWVEKLGAWRISLGRRTIAAARARIVMLSGEDKRDTLAHVLHEPDSPLPIARLQRQAALEWHIDQAAAPGRRALDEPPEQD